MLRIALAQINTTVGDLQGNTEKIRKSIHHAQEMSVNVLVFPELAVTGYPPEDLLLKKHFVRDNRAALKAIARHVKYMTAIIGFVDSDARGMLYNAAAVVRNKRVVSVYYKHALPNYGVFDEKRYFAMGTENHVFYLDRACFGVSICEDIWETKGVCTAQAKSGARALINLSASPYHAGKHQARIKLLRQRARAHKAFVCYANLVGGQDELVFDGASMIIDPQGRIIASGKQCREDFIVADLPIEAPKRKKLQRGISAVRLAKKLYTKRHVRIAGTLHKPLKPIAEIYEALVLGTRDYVQKNGFKKVVIGLSGGIDSALVAAIACDALGQENVTGVTMPSRYTSGATKQDARRLARSLGIALREIAIEPLYRAYLTALKTVFRGTKTGIAEENVQARIRGTLLMALSNKFGWLVLTTGNKSEIAVGYCTLYGDMAGGFAVIKDIPKTKVYELVRYRNQREKTPVIPVSIIKRAPSAELRKNQKDQDTLPAYGLLDRVLEAYVENDKPFAQIRGKIARPALAKRIINMVDRMEYKRRQAPPGIKITPKAFGRDRRLPITNRYTQR